MARIDDGLKGGAMKPVPFFALLATMRRSHALLMVEIAEFLQASASAEKEGMDHARVNAHTYLDAYFDAVDALNVRQAKERASS